jgi:hypothetical protein
MKPKKSNVLRFTSVEEAEMARSVLEANGIAADVQSPHMGTLMNHATGAFGGIIVNVSDQDRAEAERVLHDSPELNVSEVESEEAQESPVPAMIKRATTGAIFGALVFPFIPNLFSVSLYWKAYREDSAVFFKHPGSLITGMLFNTFALVVYPFLLYKAFLV